MRIRWENIGPIILIILAIYIFVKLKPFLKGLFAAVNVANHYDEPAAGVIKILILGIICMTILGVVKFISRR